VVGPRNENKFFLGLEKNGGVKKIIDTKVVLNG